MFRFHLPDLGEGIHEGEILLWHVAEGASVVEDAPLVDIETDKAAVTIPSPRGGRVVRHGGKVGDLIAVGKVLVEIDDGTGASPEAAEAPGASLPADSPGQADGHRKRASKADAEGVPRTPVEPSPAVPDTAATGAPGRPVPAAPATRRLARELGVDLRAVRPTGPGGRVLDADVRRHADGAEGVASGRAPEAPDRPGTREEAPAATTSGGDTPAAPSGFGPIPFLHREPLPAFEEFGPVRREPLRSVRRRTARHMVTASLVIPHVAHMDEADITELESVRRAQKERLGDRPGGRLTLLAFVMKALVAGLKAHPRFNASIDPDREEIVYKDHYHLGFAADTPRGLLVPVIRDADRRSILDLSAAVEHLAGRARDGTIGADEMRGGTFTVTNIGAMGGTGLIPLINHPEVAILGMGRAQQKPVVRDGAIAIRTMLPLVLTFDHRIADGGDAVRFVNDLVRRLQDPNALLVEA